MGHHYVVVLQNTHAPELTVTIGSIYAVNAMEAKMAALRMMFSNTSWDVIDCAEVP